MTSFLDFVCRRIASHPHLIGETTESIDVLLFSATVDSKIKSILSKGSETSPTSSDICTEAMTSLLVRSVVSPLNPLGLGHLIYNMIWPSFLAAESVATQIGRRAKVINEQEAAAIKEHEENEDSRKKLTVCLNNLEKTVAKAKKIITILESYRLC